MYKNVLLRHGESEWNKLNFFTGWSNIELTEQGKIEAIEAGKIPKGKEYSFDICFTSYLKRAIHTANLALDSLDEEYIPIVKSWKLNERHYGVITRFE